MENVKIILDNNTEELVNGIFYVYNSKYYFMYTTGELDEGEYVKLYVVQVCKEIKNTPTGPIDTGYMIGMEISNTEEWAKVQESITKIVEDKKNGTKSGDIQYLSMDMLVNLKIVGKNKFKLMKKIVEDNFKVIISPSVVTNQIDNVVVAPNNNIQNVVEPPAVEVLPVQPAVVEPPAVEVLPAQPAVESTPAVEVLPAQPAVDATANSDLIFSQTMPTTNSLSDVDNTTNTNDVIIDYRTRFFEEQVKNQELEEQIKNLNEKLNSIKNIIG